MTTLYGREARDRIWSLIKDIKVAMLATYNANGLLHARPMQQQKIEKNSGFQGVLWFFTGADTGKVEEITANPAALLTYADTDGHNYVSLNGTITISRDRAKIDELWSEVDKAWFPKGKDDPNLLLLRFEAAEAEFWDSPGMIAAGLGYIKAFFTGEQAQVGDTGHADLDIPAFEGRETVNSEAPRKPEPETVLVSTGPRDPMG
ncbi:pyridoxamine 5'-phosphate oxidase family protein [Asticcacaulis sp. BYS171W]|uniref:Pyridoxamine 5'-phosphate oxidase family protein n=1 Tax=Asticcacaulis aquaticus TaxID=2984212 RepID=A0ABT5HYA3_9CAUL|nr:pyridoxamine 5'-phosphate oxidase family protein [Asticcacaulis aquaticus]MDC7685008.1 pyridoxamine 5'-phosphate oxidase family protein [Asticcacaulis aquaticus]